MSDDPWKGLIKALPDVVKALDPSVICDHLVASQLVSDYQRQKLRSESTEDEASRRLLEILIRRPRKKQTFNKFCSILRKIPSQKDILSLFAPNEYCTNGPRTTSRKARNTGKKSARPHRSSASDAKASSGCEEECEKCAQYGSTKEADVLCSGLNCKSYYFCSDCWWDVHKRRRLTHHAPRRIRSVKLEEKICVSNVRDDEFLMTLPKLSLPWKEVEPGLFQLLKVLPGNPERVVVAEGELSNFCNTFSPGSSLDCSSIDFGSLVESCVTSIGIAGDSRAIFDFLQNHLSSKISYAQMADSKFCPTGLYALMPNKASLFLFYWRSSCSLENRSITCQMLKRLRDLCSEIILCFDKTAFLNLELPRPKEGAHQLTQDVKVREEQRSVEACQGFLTTFEATTERVVVCDSKQQLRLYTPREERSWTGRTKIYDYSEILQEFNHFQDYKIIWKAGISQSEVEKFAFSSCLRAFLRLAFPEAEKAVQAIEKEEKAEKWKFSNITARRIVKECKEEMELLKRFWIENLRSFLRAAFSLEENADPLPLRAVFDTKEYQLLRDISEKRFCDDKDKIRKHFEQLRQTTLNLPEKLYENTSCRLDVEKIYKGEDISLPWILSTVLKLFVLPFSSDEHKDFTLPKEGPLRNYHQEFYRERRENWISKCPFDENYVPMLMKEKSLQHSRLLESRIDTLHKRRNEIVDNVFCRGRLAFEVFDYTSSQGNQNKVHLSYNREYCKIKYHVHRLEAFKLMADDSVLDAEFMVKDELELRAAYYVPRCYKTIFIAFSKSARKVSKESQTTQFLQKTASYSSAGRDDDVEFANLDKSKVILTFYQKGISLVAYEADERLLGAWNKDEKMLTFYELTETLSGYTVHSSHSLKDRSIGVDMLHMQFISKANRILLVNCNSEGFIFDIRLKQFCQINGRLCFKEKEESLMAVLTCRDLVLTVSCPSSKTSDGESTITNSTKGNCYVRAYSLKGISLIPEALRYTFKGVSHNSQFRLVELQKQLHLVSIDSSAGVCQSALLNLISPASETNEILEDFYAVFRNYPVTHCYEAEMKPLKISFVIPSQLKCRIFMNWPFLEKFDEEGLKGSDLEDVSSRDAKSLGAFRAIMQQYFCSMFEALRDETGKDEKSLILAMRLQVFFSDSLPPVWSYSDDIITVEKFVLSLLTSVPIQIAEAVNDALIPLSKGVALSKPLTSVEDIVHTLSFGAHEAIFHYARKRTKVISSIGRRRVGKSFLLNHAAGAQFDVSDNRCPDRTHGVWMSVRLYPEVTVVSLDIEGFCSFERSQKEDLLMLVFGCAISSVTVLLMTDPRLDMETKQILSRFHDGDVCLRQCDLERKHVFKGKLNVVCRGVSGRDSELVKNEMTDIQKESDVQDLFGGNFFRIFTLENFGKPELFEGVHKIRQFLDEQEYFGSAVTTLYLIKKVLAKLVLKDWASLDS